MAKTFAIAAVIRLELPEEALPNSLLRVLVIPAQGKRGKNKKKRQIKIMENETKLKTRIEMKQKDTKIITKQQILLTETSCIMCNFLKSARSVDVSKMP